MAENESIGGVSVTIGGDYTPMVAAFAQAQGVAAQAGSSVASAFSAGAMAADQFRQILAEENSVLALAFQRNLSLAAAVRETGRAHGGAVTEIQAVGGAIRTGFGEQSIRAVERFLTMIPGVGVAMQALFPIIGAVALYDAIERTVGKTDQLKEAEGQLAQSVKRADEAMREESQTIDEIRAKEIGRAFGPAAGQEAQARALRQQALDYYDDIAKLQAKNKQIVADYAAAHPMTVPLSTDDWGKIREIPEVQAKIKANEEEIDALSAKAETTMAKAYDQLAESARTRTQETGTLAASRVGAELDAAQRSNEAWKTSVLGQIDLTHQATEQRIKGTEDEYLRTQQIGAEEIAFAQRKEKAITDAAIAARENAISAANERAQALSAGKTPTEQQGVEIDRVKAVTAAWDEYDKTVSAAAQAVRVAQQTAADQALDLNQRLTATLDNQVREGWDKVTDAIRRSDAAQGEATAKAIATQARVSEIQQRSSGELAELGIQRQKIALEDQYASVLVHTHSEQISYLQAEARLDSEARAAKLAGMQAELATAEAQQGSSRDLIRIATLEGQVALLKQQNADADARDKTLIDAKVTKLSEQLSLEEQLHNLTAQAQNTLQSNQQAIGQRLGQQLGEVPQSVGNDIGGAISNALLGHHPGKSIGQEMAEGLVQSLKSTLAGVLKSILSAGIQLGMGALFGFAGGTDSAPGGMALVGEKGPEIMYVPRGASIIPNHAISRYADGIGYWSSYTSSSQSFGGLHFHAHGIQDPNRFIDHVMRRLPDRLKQRSSSFSPYSH